MKWLYVFLALAAFGLLSCKAPGIDPAGNTGGGGPAGTGSPPPAGLTGPVKAALYDGTTVRLWDGTNAVAWKTGAAVHGNGRKIAVGNTLYFMAADGSVTQSMNLPATPAGVAVVGDPVVYTFEAISAAEAYAIDYTPYACTRIWQDGVEFGDWHMNQWTYASDFTCANGDIVVTDTGGRFHDISRPALIANQIEWAVDGGPLFYVSDMTHTNTLTVFDAGHPGGITVTAWSNNVNKNVNGWGGQPWKELNGIWYSAQGSIWDGATFQTYANTLSQFLLSAPAVITSAGFAYHDLSQYPVMLYANADANSLYWIECVSGALVSYTPQTNTVAVVQFLYQGDGLNATGLALASTLDLSVIDGALYYHDAGTLWKLDAASTTPSAFSADQQMWVMQ